MPRRFDSVIPGASRSSRDCRPGPSDRPNSKGCHTLIQGWPGIMEARGKACGRPALRAPCIISGKTRSEQIYGNRRSGQTRPRADKCNVLLGQANVKEFSAVWCKRLERVAFVDPQYCELRCVSWPLPFAPSKRVFQAAEELLERQAQSRADTPPGTSHLYPPP